MLAPKPRGDEFFQSSIIENSKYRNEIPDFYCHHRCDTEYIRDALEPEIAYWNYLDPVFIDAGTGKGKSTFDIEVLIQRAQRLGKNVVILTNRSALNLQQKLAVVRCVEPELEEQLTAKGIRDRDIFGNTAVLVYQALPRFVNDPSNRAWLENVFYLVADECHYFCADAGFNRNCEYHLKLITKHFTHAIRIYQTATSWDVLYVLAEAEKSIPYLRERFLAVAGYFGMGHERRFHRYYWEENFDHVDLHFTGGLDEITQIICQKPREKFLVFVDSKERGREFARELGNRAIYLDADSKGSKEMEKLLKDNAFEEQVLVTTKVLDCGVNIWDNRLRNVVVMTDDRTSMIQMLGRKRCKPGERVNLYVCDMPRQVLLKRHRDGCVPYEAKLRYEKYGEENRRRMGREIWNGDDDRLRLYFRLTDSGLVKNHLAFYALIRKLFFYEDILLEKTTFRAAVCEWLGKTLEPEVVPADELAAFCEAHLGQELSEDEIATVRELIVKAAGATGFVEPQPTRVATLGRDALNNRMGKFNSPYRFEKNIWKINKEE